MKSLYRLVLCALVAGLPSAAAAQTKTGVLVLAHGGQPQWNERVLDVVPRRLMFPCRRMIGDGVPSRPVLDRLGQTGAHLFCARMHERAIPLHAAHG